MLLNVLPRLSTRCGELVSCGSGAASRRGRNRPHRAWSVAAAAAVVAVNAALGVEPAKAQGLPSKLLITDVRATEGDSMTFSVIMPAYGVVEGGFKVKPTFTDGSTQHSGYGTATKGTDYTENTPTLTFEGEPNETHTFTVATIEDSVWEATEIFTVGLIVSETEARFGTDTATGYILNDDAPALTIGNASASEGDGITFTVTVDGAVSGGFKVTPSFTGGTATKGTDYTATANALTFAGTAGETQSFTVATTEDAAVEPDETFTVSLAVSGTSTTVTATDTATGTIRNDDVPALTIADASADEGDGITFTVTLDKAVSSGQFYVDPTFTDGTATKNTDYTVNTESLDFAGTAGETQSFTVATTEDAAFEPDETFTVSLTVTGASETITATDTATGTIRNDDIAPALTIDDASAAEGDEIAFTVTLDKAVSGGLTVTPSFTDGTATKGTDYIENTAALTFAGTAGETQTFTVATRPEWLVEPDETFTVSLTVSGTTATITATDTATGTIQDDDTALTLTIEDASATEGDEITFRITLKDAFPLDRSFQVQMYLDDGTATQWEDFHHPVASGDLDINARFAGNAGETVTWTMRTIEDDHPEPDETFTVRMVPLNEHHVTFTTNTATGTIVDDDEDNDNNDDDAPALTIDDASAAEGAGITFTVTLDKAVSGGLTVTPSFTDGTATKDTDYSTDAPAIDFAGTAGETQTFTVATTDDAVVEPDETFTVSLAATGTSTEVTATDTATGTILDDDGAPAVNLSVSPPSVGEGASGTTVTVTAAFSTDKTLTEDRTVTVSVGGGTATSDTDYEAISNLDITIPKGAASGTGTFTLRPIQDTAFEGNETIDVAGAAGELTVNGTHLTLTDDDGAPAVNLSVSPSSVSEGDAPTTVTVTAALSGSSTFAADTTVRVSVGGGTATSGTDYEAIPNLDVTIAEGAASGTGTFTLRPIQDTAFEGNETIDVAGAAGELTVNGTRLTLTDDDGAPAVNLSVSPSSVSEGDAPTTVTVTAVLSGSSAFSTDTTVRVSVGGGTATSGADYEPISNIDITIPKDATSGTGTFTLRPIQDTMVESNATIDVAGAAGDLTVNGTWLMFTDDDGVPEVNLSVSPSKVSEGDASTTVTVTAAFSSSSTFSTDTTIGVSVGGGTATSGTDYAAVSDFNVEIRKGETSGTATFTLTPTADAEVEAAETIRVAGGAPGLTVNGTRLTLTDSTPRLSVGAARAAEGENMVFTVTLQSAGPRAVTVQYATADGSAAAGADYTSTSGQLVFSADETEQTVSVPVADDDEVEENETFVLAVQLADAQGPPASGDGNHRGQRRGHGHGHRARRAGNRRTGDVHGVAFVSELVRGGRRVLDVRRDGDGGRGLRRDDRQAGVRAGRDREGGCRGGAGRRRGRERGNASALDDGRLGRVARIRLVGRRGPADPHGRGGRIGPREPHLVADDGDDSR